MSKNKKGCMFWGCLSLFIIFLIVGLLVFMGYRMVRNKAFQYTSENPVPLEQVEYTQKEADVIVEKINNFIENIKKGESAVKETFTDRDINIFIESNKEAAELKDKVKINFEDNKIKGTLNVPLKDIPIVDGRYLVGDAEFDVACEDGLLFVTLKSMVVNGKTVPENFMKDLRGKNLAADLYKNPKNSAILKRLKLIKMENNKLTIEVDSGLTKK